MEQADAPDCGRPHFFLPWQPRPLSCNFFIQYSQRVVRFKKYFLY